MSDENRNIGMTVSKLEVTIVVATEDPDIAESWLADIALAVAKAAASDPGVACLGVTVDGELIP